MAVTGLFAGIGGFERAFSQAGIETNLLVEVDQDASNVLRRRFPESYIQENVLDVTDIPGDTTILTSGFPCQNLSMAGDKIGHQRNEVQHREEDVRLDRTIRRTHGRH